MMKAIERFEIGLPILFLIGLLLVFQQISFGVGLILLALGLGFGIHFIKILQKPIALSFSKETLWIVRLVHICLSITFLGIGLKILKIEFGESVLAYSLLAFVPVLIAFLFDFRFSTSWAVVKHHKRLLARSLLIIAIGFLFYITPETKLSRLFQPKKMEEKR